MIPRAQTCQRVHANRYKILTLHPESRHQDPSLGSALDGCRPFVLGKDPDPKNTIYALNRTIVPASGLPLTPFFFIHSTRTLFSDPWMNSAPISTGSVTEFGQRDEMTVRSCVYIDGLSVCEIYVCMYIMKRCEESGRTR